VDVPEVSIGFAPQPGPQSHFVYCPYDSIVVYGGARGGGKTYATLGEFWIHAETYGHAAKGLMIRRTREDLKDTRETAVEMFGNAARWQDKGSMFRFKSGAILYLAYLESDDDATHYQGWSLTRSTSRKSPSSRTRRRSSSCSPHCGRNWASAASSAPPAIPAVPATTGSRPG
jgi:hypothetical protein